jgi:DNA-directed RNA polymerase subunit K/omega
MSVDFKKSNAHKTTVTQNLAELDKATGNIYESLVIISKRADQVNDELRAELHDKLEEFATSAETLEEIFDNKEQIEVSKHYENLPKPMAVATDEWLSGQVYFRNPNTAEAESKGV